MSQHDRALIGPDQFDGAGEDAVEHDGEISRVRADQFEDLAGGRLEFERLSELCVALLDVGQEPRVRNGIAGLCSERLQEFDLVGRERVDRVAECEDTDRWPVAREGHEHRRSDTCCIRGLDRLGVGGIGDLGLVVECQRNAFTKHLRQRRVVAEGALETAWFAAGAVSVERDDVSLAHEDSAARRTRELGCPVGDLVQQCCEVATPGDSSQHAGQRSFTSQRCPELCFDVVCHGPPSVPSSDCRREAPARRMSSEAFSTGRRSQPPHDLRP